MRAAMAVTAVWTVACLWACGAGPGAGTETSSRRRNAPPAAAESPEPAPPAQPAPHAEPVQPAEPAAAAQHDQASCPPPDPQPHCLLLTLRPGAAARATAFITRAARDGIEVHREGSLLIAYLTDDEITRHFGGRVVYHRVAASASNTGAADMCNAYLEDAVIPAKYARELASIAIGHQICE